MAWKILHQGRRYAHYHHHQKRRREIVEKWLQLCRRLKSPVQRMQGRGGYKRPRQAGTFKTKPFNSPTSTTLQALETFSAPHHRGWVWDYMHSSLSVSMHNVQRRRKEEKKVNFAVGKLGCEAIVSQVSCTWEDDDETEGATETLILFSHPPRHPLWCTPAKRTGKPESEVMHQIASLS